MTENISYVICRICGLRKRELNGHLRVHSITSKDYLNEFPNAIIMCEELSIQKGNKIRETIPNRPPVSLETREKMAKAKAASWQKLRGELGDEAYFELKRNQAKAMRDRKGENWKHSEETKEKMRGPRPHAKRPHSDETKQKLKEAAKNRLSRGPHSPETIEKMKEAWSKRKENEQEYAEYINKLKERMTTPEAIARVRNNVAKRLENPNMAQRQFDTKPEKMFQLFLEDNNINYTKQHKIITDNGTWTYDFFLPDMNILVEIDGEYWHSKSKEIINRDIIKGKIAKNNKLLLVRITDIDFKPAIIFESEDQIINHNSDIINKRLSLF